MGDLRLTPAPGKCKRNFATFQLSPDLRGRICKALKRPHEGPLSGRIVRRNNAPPTGVRDDPSPQAAAFPDRQREVRLCPCVDQFIPVALYLGLYSWTMLRCRP